MPQFRAKARAVDLLGKGQIADLPTAISELWKNGYDAYGDNLEAFLYPKDYRGYKEPVFVLSDDGKGMSREDILEKWFVLGTDSKTRNEQDEQGKETLWKAPRIKMGEKGIGRLSVAYLGPQMLMLTKKRNMSLEAVFFDWRILDNYNLFLEDINIPIRKVDAENYDIFFQELKDEFLENFPDKIVGADPWKEQAELKEEIKTDCARLDLPTYLFEDFIKSDRFNKSTANGTVFIVFQPDKQIIDLRNAFNKDGSNDLDDSQSINHTVATLVGLFNLFKTYNPEHKTVFNVMNESGPFDLLKATEFFTPDDFDDADHAIIGKFDIYGNFTGKVRIYNKTVDHTFSPFKIKSNKTSYGSFGIKLGYVQSGGDRSPSMIPEEKKVILDKKLELYSGLFIYRDGFRVLPYGRPDSDFLEFEERRSRSAGDYFFSKRRMFGYLEITRKNNDKLKDKSSREGFINNVNYRDFKVDLISFFKDLAKKYFASKSEYEYKDEQQKEMQKQSEAAKQEHQREIEERRKFAQNLNQLPKDLDALEKQFNEDLQLLQLKVTDPSAFFAEIQPVLDRIERAKIRYSDLKLSKPTRFKPTDLQRKKYTEYQKQYAGFTKVVEASDKAIKGLRNKLKLVELFSTFEARSELLRNDLASQFNGIEDRLDRIFRKIQEQIAKEKELFLLDFSDKNLAITPQRENADDIYNSMGLLDNIFNESKNRLAERFAPYLNHLDRLSLEVNEDNLVGYYKDQFEEMKKEWEQTYQLAQLGIAVEIIDHQFNTLYSQLAENIKSLSNYLQSDTVAQGKYNLLVNSFNHLEDNYKLLQPLYRTTGKVPKDVKGEELYSYLSDFFSDRLKENDINFTITTAGEKWSAYSYESIFKPVLINVVNNAIFWLQPAEKRKIVIDEKDGSLLIMNSGMRIDDTVLDDIFNLFYSERPSGRGIGLYLAKKSLKGIGFDITATNKPDYNLLNGACFVISTIKP